MRSPRARLSALTLAAIVAPAAVVAVLGWLSLRQWQVSAELLFREQARDVASMAAQKVDMMLRHAEEGFLDRLQVALVLVLAVRPHVRRLARETRRVASVCTGAGVLAQAGVLDGRRAATHWDQATQLAHRFPEVVCTLHLGLVQAALAGNGADPDRADLQPFAAPHACHLRLLD